MTAPAALSTESFFELHRRLVEVDADVWPIHMYLGSTTLYGDYPHTIATDPTPYAATDVIVGCTYHPETQATDELAPHRIVFGEYTIGTPNFSLLFSEVRYEQKTLILSQGRSMRWPHHEHVIDWFASEIMRRTSIKNVANTNLVAGHFSRLSSLVTAAVNQRPQRAN